MSLERTHTDYMVGAAAATVVESSVEPTLERTHIDFTAVAAAVTVVESSLEPTFN